MYAWFVKCYTYVKDTVIVKELIYPSFLGLEFKNKFLANFSKIFLKNLQPILPSLATMIHSQRKNLYCLSYVLAEFLYV